VQIRIGLEQKTLLTSPATQFEGRTGTVKHAANALQRLKNEEKKDWNTDHRQSSLIGKFKIRLTSAGFLFVGFVRIYGQNTFSLFLKKVCGMASDNFGICDIPSVSPSRLP
jgi:hypothetical protein